MAAIVSSVFGTHLSGGLTERIHSSFAHTGFCRPVTSSGVFLRPISYSSALSPYSVFDSQYCLGKNTSSSCPMSETFLANVLLEHGVQQGRVRKSFRKVQRPSIPDSQRWSPRRASNGDTIGNNHIQFSPEPGPGSHDGLLRKDHVPLYVMLPLDTVTIANTLNRVRALQVGLRALKIVGVDGVMMHVWWGIVEADAPAKYNWSAYLALVKMINMAGLKVQASICFHACSNAGDNCSVPLPPWILSLRDNIPDIFYTDRGGYRNEECLSLAVDTVPLLEGRSPMQMYTDFLESFSSTFSPHLGNTVVAVVMGLGPKGELRYPAFPKANGRWAFPGVGEFQCYDQNMLESLNRHSLGLDKPEWGRGGPPNTPSYNQWPNESGFFRDQHGSWDSPYGDFFLTWYSGELLAHADRMLAIASSIFRNEKVVIAGKVPAVHWWYRSKAHAAELTAGYYNTEGRDGYDEVARVFMQNEAMMILPGIEMSDMEQPREARCSPELLLLQIRKACSKYGVPVAGENSLPRFDRVAHMRIKNSVHRYDYPYLPRLAAFTFLRMDESLFHAEHWRFFVYFVRDMDKDGLWGDDNNGPPKLDKKISLTSHVDRKQEVASSHQCYSINRKILRTSHHTHSTSNFHI